MSVACAANISVELSALFGQAKVGKRAEASSVAVGRGVERGEETVDL